MKMLKLGIIASFSLVIVGSVAAQVMKKGVTIESDQPGGIYFLMGPQAAMRESDDGLVIDFVAPADSRAKDYADVDLKAGDIVMMVNGKRVKTAADIEKMVNDLETGAMIKLGVKRDRDMMIVSFAKPDPEEAGGPMMMVTRTVGDDGNVDTDIKMAGPDLDKSVLVMEAGVILATTDDGLAVGVVIDNAETDLDGDAPGDGDVIMSINGTTVKTNGDFSAVYDATPPGEQIALVYLHDGAEKTVKFKKSAEQPVRVIKKGH